MPKLPDNLPTPTWCDEEYGVALYRGDCLEVLPGLPDGCVDVVITDPPYGINHSTHRTFNDDGKASWNGTQIAGDHDTSTRDKAIVGFPNAAVFGHWARSPIANCRGALVWDKGPAFGMGDLTFPWKASWELIFIRGKLWRGHRGEGVLRGHIVVSWETRGRQHPHQKPVTLISELLAKLPRLVTICDMFMGTGSSGVASVLRRHPFIGMECDLHYFDIAVKRIRQAIIDHQGGPLFAEHTPKQAELFDDGSDG